MKVAILTALVSGAVLLGGCSSQPKVTRTAADEVVDLSGRWNDSDSRMTAETMVASMLSSVWLERFTRGEERQPVVIIGRIQNRSSEHIDSINFTKAIERELVNSGAVSFVADSQARREVREEREEQQSNATAETTAALASETGADYMMQGVITSQTDAIEGQKVTLYTVDLELVDMESNQKVWIDTQDIKKIVEQRNATW